MTSVAAISDLWALFREKESIVSYSPIYRPQTAVVGPDMLITFGFNIELKVNVPDFLHV